MQVSRPSSPVEMPMSIPVDIWRAIIARCDPETVSTLGEVDTMLHGLSREALKKSDWSPYEHLALRRPKSFSITLAHASPDQRNTFTALSRPPARADIVPDTAPDALPEAISASIRHCDNEALEALCARGGFDINTSTPGSPSLVRSILPPPSTNLTPLQRALVPHRDNSAALMVETLLAHGADVHSHERPVRMIFFGHALGENPFDRAVSSADWYALHAMVRVARKAPKSYMPNMLDMFLDFSNYRELDKQRWPHAPLRARWGILRAHIQMHRDAPWVALTLRICAETIMMKDFWAEQEAWAEHTDVKDNVLPALTSSVCASYKALGVDAARARYRGIPAVLRQRLEGKDHRVGPAIAQMLRAVTVSEEDLFLPPHRFAQC